MIKHLAHLVVSADEGIVSVSGMIGEAAARYNWLCPDTRAERYDGVLARQLTDQSPAEILAVARNHGNPYPYPHITDVLRDLPATEIATAPTDNLKQAIAWLPNEYSIRVMSCDAHYGLSVCGVPLGGQFVSPATFLFRASTLRAVLDSLSPGCLADLASITRGDNCKALRIIVNGLPREEYYIPAALDSLTGFLT